jgi:gliding motility-associated-like protein
MSLLRTTSLLFLFLFTSNLPAQNLTFESTYDLDAIYAYASLTNVINTNDGGYAFPVLVNGPSFDTVHLTLIKTAADGTLQWTKTLVPTSRLEFYSANVNAYIIQTSDGGYAVDALVRSPTSSADPSLVVFRLDAAANVIWEASFTGDFRLTSDMMQATDGGLIVTGTIFDTLIGHDFWMAKLDAAGNCLWSKSYDLTMQDDFLTSADYTSDGGIIMAGGINVNNTQKMGIIKTDGNGNLLWGNLYYSGNTDWPLQIRQTTNSDLVVAGRSGNPALGYFWDISGVRLDANGNVIWSNFYGGADWDEGYSVTQATDGGFVFAVEPESFATQSESCLMKTDANGNLAWTKRFAATDGGFPSAVITAPDGGYFMTGAIGSTNAVPFAFKLLLVKTDANGNTACAADSVTMIRTPMVITTSPAGVSMNSVTSTTSSHTWNFPVPLYTYICPLTDSTTSPTPPIPENLQIPNVFTPNGSAPNDLFEITYTGNETYHIEIYDRWGVLLFVSDDKGLHWDGRSTSGKEAVAGTYYYILTIGANAYKGFLTLLR